MLNTEPDYASEGNIIFIQEGDKRRPHICVKVFKNKAGVPYNWLVLPITGSTSVGHDNLFQIEHPKLHKKSYVKINNIQTIRWDNDYEIKSKIDKLTLDKLIKRICKSLNYEHFKRKNERSVEKQKE